MAVIIYNALKIINEEKREKEIKKKKVTEMGRVTKSVDIIVLILNHKVATVEATSLHSLGFRQTMSTLSHNPHENIPTLALFLPISAIPQWRYTQDKTFPIPFLSL